MALKTSTIAGLEYGLPNSFKIKQGVGIPDLCRSISRRYMA